MEPSGESSSFMHEKRVVVFTRDQWHFEKFPFKITSVHTLRHCNLFFYSIGVFVGTRSSFIKGTPRSESFEAQTDFIFYLGGGLLKMTDLLFIFIYDHSWQGKFKSFQPSNH